MDDSQPLTGDTGAQFDLTDCETAYRRLFSLAGRRADLRLALAESIMGHLAALCQQPAQSPHDQADLPF